MPYDAAKRKAWIAAGYRSDLSSAAADLPPPPEFVRLYYLSGAAHALSNIAFGRLKLARFRDLNDPFELLSVSLIDKKLRSAVRDFKANLDAQTGLLCLSEDWGSPVMWSHYGEKHRGICLGFDVRRAAVDSVKYDDKRIRAALHADADPNKLPDDLQAALRTTKCHEWNYERERRMCVPLSEAREIGALHFRGFDESLRLAEVILGPNCVEPLEDVRDIVAKHHPGVRTYKARLAWQHFKVVPFESSVP